MGVEQDGSLTFSSDNSHPEGPQRAHRLVALLKWFPLPIDAAEHVTPARTERLTLADVALHLWGMNVGPDEKPIEQQSDADFRDYLGGLGMLPGWFRKPAFLRHPDLIAWAKSRADMFRTLDLSDFDEAGLIARLKGAGWTERMVGQDVAFDELRRPAFPIRVARSASDVRQQADFDYLRDALASAHDLISLADVEQLLLDRNYGRHGFLREYTN